MPANNYLIMSGDTPVAKWENNRLTVLCNAILPLYLKRIYDADGWLETRAIDSHRANSRLLKKALRLQERDDLATVMNVNGATITDNYWVKPLDSDLTYEDVKFDKNYFSTLALKGTYNSFNRAANAKSKKTPELTNIGSYEKCWRLVDGKWWMYKSANHSEMFSELFVYELGSALGMNMAVYERGDKCVKTKDFTEGRLNFEPAFAFMGDNEDYEDTVKKLKEICPEAVKDYIGMIFLDAITANPDRHTANFGLLREQKSGKLLGLAPLFDHNMALIARGYPQKPTKGDLLITLFNELIDEFPEYRTVIPTVTEELVRKIIGKLNMKVKTEEIIRLVMSRFELIKK